MQKRNRPQLTDTIVLRLIQILLKLSNEFHIDISKLVELNILKLALDK